MVVEFGLDDGVWRLHGHGAPDGALATARTATAHREPTLSEVAFRFRVSPDEEFASWSVDTGDREVDLGGRSFVYLLVTLARERLADRARGLGLADRGWMVGDELARRLGMTPETMKVHVYRAREQLRDVGVLGAGGVVERRSTTNQIRFGSDRIRVDVAAD